jgi:hypothetical protein
LDASDVDAGVKDADLHGSRVVAEIENTNLKARAVGARGVQRADLNAREALVFEARLVQWAFNAFSARAAGSLRKSRTLGN